MKRNSPDNSSRYSWVPVFHDGRFTTLLDVVNHYNSHFRLNLNEGQKADLIEYVKSL